MNKEGFIFTLDSILALGIALTLIAGAGVYFSITPELKYRTLHSESEDVMESLSMKSREIQSVEEIINLTQAEKNKSALELIGSLWVSNETEKAENLTEKLLENLTECYELTMSGESIYKSCEGEPKTIASASRIASGYKIGKAEKGFISRGSLNKIRKIDSSYLYFGGYVGDGNLTRNLTLKNMDTVILSEMEMDPGSSFKLFINGNFSGEYVPTQENLSMDEFTICNETYRREYCGYFKNGENKLEFNFTGNQSAIRGGVLKVKYNTTEFGREELRNKYKFPGINGLLNLYSSFYVPGDLKNLSAKLHYRSNYPVFFTIGGEEVYRNDTKKEETVLIKNSSFSNLFDYSDLSKKTIPLRFGLETFKGGKGNADVILITDLSGSMENCLDGSSSGCTNVDGSNPQRIELAKKLDKEFVNITLNVSGNRVGLVTYNTSLKSFHNLSNDSTILRNEIEGYSSGGGTCVCCAIRKARQILENSDPERDKWIIVMTDGIPNGACNPDNLDDTEACADNDNSICWNFDCSSWYSTCTCRDPCDNADNYKCCLQDKTDTCDDWVGQEAIEDAINDSCRASNQANATIYSIGFITQSVLSDCPEANETLRGIADCGEGNYSASTNKTELEKIYRRIAERIVKISYKAQKINASEALMNNTLYPDSWIKFDHIPTTNPLRYREISLDLEGKRFGGEVESPKNGSFFVPNESRVLEARVTSYSSEYWTDRLKVKNLSSTDWKYVYKLWEYGSDYKELGDPYRIEIPVNEISTGWNNVSIDTAISPNKTKGGSPNNTVIYRIALKANVPYSKVFPKAEGSSHLIYYDMNKDGSSDGSFNVSIGPNSSDPYDPQEDSIDNAFSRLLDKVNFINDKGAGDGESENPIDVYIKDLNFESSRVGGIRWLWGPAVFTLKVW